MNKRYIILAVVVLTLIAFNPSLKTLDDFIDSSGFRVQTKKKVLNALILSVFSVEVMDFNNSIKKAKGYKYHSTKTYYVGILGNVFKT